MSTYTLNIKSTKAGREAAMKGGYKFVFAKGVVTGRGTSNPEYNAAWFTLDPGSMADTETVTWTVRHVGTFTTHMDMVDGTRIDGNGNEVPLDNGGKYNVTNVGEMVKFDSSSSPGFSFYNSAGFKAIYTPIIKTAVDGREPTSIWAATTGVPMNGRITAVPVEKVRVWLGKYEEGDAVLAEYETQAVEFDLTTKMEGTANLNDDLSGWNTFTINARLVSPF